MKYPNDSYYLIKLQYLGFRFHGWQKQPDVKTIQGILERTLCFIFKHDSFKTLAASRTDAMVSANEAYCHLTTKEAYKIEWLMNNLNKNLPQDIAILDISEIGPDFDILQKNKQKEYHYLFSHGERNHPFCATLMTGKHQTLDIERMQQGATLFKGTHNFKKYTIKPKENTQTERQIFTSEIIENSLYTANFFPKQSFIYRVVGPGFMRYQIRMMMGQLFLLGAHEISLEDIKKSLIHYNKEKPLTEIAPASGLILHKSEFE